MGGAKESTRLYVDIVKRLPGFELNVQFEAECEKVGLLGSSGSGKSMTLKCIAGIETPDQGTIVLGGRVLFDSKKKINIPSRARGTGYLFQNYALFPHMTVIKNMMAGMQSTPKRDRVQSAQKLIDELHLEGLENHYPHQLSGGQQQRAAIGRMLAAKPDILMFDEPFSALDCHLKEKLQGQLLELLEERAVTALMVSHDIDEVYRLCDKIAVIQNGKIELLGTKKEVFEKPTKLSAVRLTGCKNISKIKQLKDNEVLAEDWGIVLKVPEVSQRFESQKAYIGIRAHHLILTDTNEENTFQYNVIKVSETRFGITAVFGVTKTSSIYEGEITLEADKTIWRAMKNGRMPRYIKFPKDKILLFGE